jgi:hypothetical protein
MLKTFSQSDCSSLIKYAWKMSNIELERTTYIQSKTIKFHQNPTNPSEDIMQKTFSLSDWSSLIKYSQNLSNIKFEEGLMYQVSQASFIKIPPFLEKISCRKLLANQIATASLNMHGKCRTLNLSKRLIY